MFDQLKITQLADEMIARLAADEDGQDLDQDMVETLRRLATAVAPYAE